MWQQSWQTWKVQVSYNRGGGTGLVPNLHFQWFIFRVPGWHCIAGVLLSAEGVISSAEGVLLSGHIEFPGHITLQVSFCVTLSFLVTCLGHSEFPGHLSIIIWMDTWISWNCSWMRYHPDSYTGCSLVAGSWMLSCIQSCSQSDLLLYWHAQSFLPIFSVWPIFSIICEKESSWIFTGIIFCILDWNFMVWPLDGVS